MNVALLWFNDVSNGGSTSIHFVYILELYTDNLSHHTGRYVHGATVILSGVVLESTTFDFCNTACKSWKQLRIYW